MCIGETQALLCETVEAGDRKMGKISGSRRVRSEDSADGYTSPADDGSWHASMAHDSSTSKRQRGSEDCWRNTSDWRTEQARILHALTPPAHIHSSQGTEEENIGFSFIRGQHGGLAEPQCQINHSSEQDSAHRYAGVSSLVAFMDFSISPSGDSTEEEDDTQNNLSFLFKYTHVSGGC